MKNIAFSLITSLLLYSCAEEKKVPEPTIFKGKIAHATTDTISLRDGDFVEKIALKEDGSFADTIKLPEAGYYSLRVNNEITTLFLSPNKTHKVSLNAKEFDESLKYSEAHAAENNYLAKKFLLSEKIGINQQKYSTMPEDSLLAAVKKNKVQYLELLSDSKGLDSNFVELEKKSIGYTNELTKQMYAFNSENNYYDTLANTPTAKHFLNENIDLDNAEDYDNFSNYQRLVSLDFYKETSLLHPEDTSYIEKAFRYIENLESENIKNDLLDNIAYRLGPGNKNAEKLYNKLMSASTNAEFKEKLTKKYEIIKTLKKGKPSPTFTYKNHKGGKTSLESLKGKYVYIDVWATWCGPCLRQIPALKEIEEEYNGRNIHFVSISIDTDDAYDKWKKMVVEKELGGIQLIADNNWNSEFVKNYAIDGIPRFILLDPEGNIVSADAPRPTNPELTGLFESLGI